MVLDRVTLGVLVAGTILLLVLGLGYFAPPDVPYEPRVPERDIGEQAILENLAVPWEIEFLPAGDVLVTERPGTLLRIDSASGQRYRVDGVQHQGEGGLLGVAAHPDYEQNNQIYLYMTADDQDGDGLINRVVRYTLEEHNLSDPQTIIDGIPGAAYHDGGRIAFGPDGKLYVTTGDSGNPQLAQDRDSLAGKILRLNPDGSVPADNPLGTPVYSYGHRNAQGLAWDEQGNLWATEHGDQATDELNLVQTGNNYGWPIIEGAETQEGMVPPIHTSGRFRTWAPAGAAYVDGHIVFAGLRGQRLYVAEISGGDVSAFDTFLQGEYGRLRAVTLGPDGYLYVSTSNTDGRGNPAPNDDRILRIDPDRLVS